MVYHVFHCSNRDVPWCHNAMVNALAFHAENLGSIPGMNVEFFCNEML